MWEDGLREAVQRMEGVQVSVDKFVKRIVKDGDVFEGQEVVEFMQAFEAEGWRFGVKLALGLLECGRESEAIATLKALVEEGYE